MLYGFASFKPPAGKKLKAGKNVAVSFKLSDALGYVTVGSATLEVAPVTGEGVGNYKPATSTVNAGDQFQAAKGGVQLQPRHDRTRQRHVEPARHRQRRHRAYHEHHPQIAALQSA